MNRKMQQRTRNLRRLVQYLALSVVAGALIVAAARATDKNASATSSSPGTAPLRNVISRGGGSGVPQQINHQGVVEVNGVRFNGIGSFRFAIVDAGSGIYYWTNDGSTPTPPAAPSIAVPLPVSNGVYSVRLGDPSFGNMVELPGSVFSNDSVRLRTWFDDGIHGVQQLNPDQPLTSSPYSFRAAVADFALESAIGSGAIPGEIRMWAGPEATIPSGWLLCDGSEQLRAGYPNLFAAISTSWGSGNGSTTFHLPDLQGRFVRGVDRGAAIDPDAGSRVASNAGGNAGDAVGSTQLDATARPRNTAFTTNTTGNHTHTNSAHLLNGGGPQRLAGGVGSAFQDDVTSSSNGSHSHSVASRTTSPGSGGGDSETRPVNAYVHFIIKS